MSFFTNHCVPSKKMNYVSIKKRTTRTKSDEVILNLRFYKNGEKPSFRVINIRGKEKDWDNKAQCFKAKSSDANAKNASLCELKEKYIKIAEQWDSEEKKWKASELASAYDVIHTTKTSNNYLNLMSYLSSHINIEKAKGGSNHEHYGTLYRTLGRFFKSQNINVNDVFFSDINSVFLSSFFQYLKNNNIANIRGYYNTFKSLCNRAINDEIEGSSVRFFKNINCQSYITKKVDEDTDPKIYALTEDQSKQFLQIKLDMYYNGTPVKDQKTELYYDLVKFTLFTLMSPCDVMLLKKSSIKNLPDTGLSIVYKREKTKNKCSKSAIVRISKEIQEIIDKYEHKSKDGYVFPILNNAKYNCFLQIERRRQTIGSGVNTLLKRIGKDMQLSFPLTWYCFRRTGITNLLHNGIMVEVVAQIAGNTPKIIYMHYLKVEGNKKQESNLHDVFSRLYALPQQSVKSSPLR